MGEGPGKKLALFHETDGYVTGAMRGLLNRVKVGLLSGLIDPLGERPANLPAYLYLPDILRNPAR